MQNVNLDGALAVLVIRVVADGEDGWVDGCWGVGGGARGVGEVGDGVAGRLGWDGCVVCCAGDAGGCGTVGDGGVV